MDFGPMDKQLVALFTDVASGNPDTDHRSFYVDSAHVSVAYAGYRRSWGLGDLIARFRTEDDLNFPKAEGVYFLENKEFIVNQQFLGPCNEEGLKIALTKEDVNNLFAGHYQTLEESFVLRLNPEEILDFIDDATYTDSIDDRVINISPFYQMNASGHFVAQLYFNGERGAWFAVMQTKTMNFAARVQEDGDRIFRFDRAKDGEYVIFEPIGKVEDERVCRALRYYKPGIRMAIQHFNSGCRMPGDPFYSVTPNEHKNGIRKEHVKDFTFIEGQELPPLNNAPMITVQLDTFVRAMHALSTFRTVNFHYINSHTPWIVYGTDPDKRYQIDVVASSLSVYKLGKIITQ